MSFMKKKLFFLLLTELLPLIMLAQPPQWANPLPTGHIINAIAFFDETHGLMCGEKGVLLTSSDGGSNWQEQYWDGFSALNQLEVTGLSQAYVIADTFLLKTLDYGNTFTAVGQLPSGYAYQSFSMYSSTEGVALRHNPSLTPAYELGYTNDGGNTWTWNPFTVGYESVDELRFKDSLHGVCTVSDYSGHILYTTDGGNTWTMACTVITDEDTGFKKIEISSDGSYFVYYSFLSAQSYTTMVYKSADDGITWTPIYYEDDGNRIAQLKTLGDNFIIFVSRGETYLNNAQNILYSTNGGSTWNKAIIPEPYGYGRYEVFRSVGIKNINQAFVFCESLQQMLASQSTGQFEFISANFSEHICNITFSENQGYIFVKDAYNSSPTRIRKSNNGGLTWNLLPTVLSGWPYFGIFTSADYGYVVTTEHLGFVSSTDLYKTMDGGSLWSIICQLDTAYPIGFEAFGYDTVIIMSKYSITPFQRFLKVSYNAGLSWAECNLPSNDINSFDFITGLEGYIFGGLHSGIVWRTFDGGNTWSEMSVPLNQIQKGQVINNVQAFVSILNSQNIPEIHRIDLNNGNTTLVFSTLDSNTWISDFSFTDNDFGYVISVGHGGLWDNCSLYKTINGGTDWELLGVYPNIYKLKTFYEDNGFAYGNYGSLVMLADGYPLSNNQLTAKPDSKFKVATDGHQIRVEIPDISYFPAMISVFDLQGRRVYTSRMHSTENVFSLILKQGLYLYRIDHGKGFSSGKLLLAN